MTMRLYALV